MLGLQGLRAVSSLCVSEAICTGEHAAGDGWSSGDALGGAFAQEEGAGLPETPFRRAVGARLRSR